MKKKIIVILLLIINVWGLISCDKDTFPLAIKKCSNYNITCTLDDTDKTLTCTQKVRVYNNSNDDWSELKFHLYPKAFTEGAINPAVGVLYVSKAYPNGKSYGDITISSLTNCGNQTAYFTEGDDDNILVVKLENKLKSDEFTEIELNYVVNLANINHRLGYGENTINVANFYPILCVYENNKFSTNPYSINGDPFYSEVSNYKVTLNYPKKYIMACSGEVQSHSQTDEYYSSMVVANNVRDFAFVLSDKFKVLSEKVNDTTVNYYYYQDEQSETSLKTCVDSLKTFNNLFGNYPYKVLNVVETNFVYGGMEYPNLVYISDSISNYADYTNTIVHEIAHQWWYGLVGNDEYTYGWLDEGLTEYSTLLFYEDNPSYNVDTKEMIENTNNSYLLFIQVYKDVFGNVNTTMTRKVNEYNTEPEYVYIAYVKGMLLMNDIRETVGRENFVKGLKIYKESYSGKNVTPENFVQCIEKASRQTLQSFVQSYIDGKDVMKDN